MSRERSPTVKLVMAGLIAIVLIVPLMMVYALVYDRESQSQTAQSAITAGWGGAQTVTGPVLVIPYMKDRTEIQTVDGASTTRTVSTRHELFVSPSTQSLDTQIDPDRKGYAIYETVVYDTAMSGTARFDMPEDLDRLDVDGDALLLDQIELRFGISDPRGLKDDAQVLVGGEALMLQPGNGPAATSGSGFSAFTEWTDGEPLNVQWQYGIRGSHSLTMLPRGGETEWNVTSTWPHPSFSGGFLPETRDITAEGFTATYPGITNLALGRRLTSLTDEGPPQMGSAPMSYDSRRGVNEDVVVEGTSQTASIGLVDPVDLYSQVDRAVKYGFLFIGFTFATFLMFDVVGGARVAAAEYLLTGAGLILFFVMLLAFAEVIGFGWAYVVAAAAVIGLLTAYSAAVLGTWRRAGFIGGMLAGLYGLLFVLLNMETYSLVIGSLLLFAALAGIMYATRSVNWSAVGRSDDGEEVLA